MNPQSIKSPKCPWNKVPAGIVLLFIWFFAGSAWARAGVNIIGGNGGWPEFVRIEKKAMVPFAEAFSTRDDNFREDGVLGFTGIRLSRLTDLAGADLDCGLTVIGTDQYVGYLPKETLGKGFLVWEINGRPINGLKGGPLKVVFPEDAGIHPSCYTWYVSAMVAGRGEGARLAVSLGEKLQRYSLTDLSPHAVPLDRSLFSIAQGCRNDLCDLPPVKAVRAVPLSWFLSRFGLDKTHSGLAVRLIPFAGPEITLGPGLLDHPVFIVVSCDNRAVHPALGGPFSIVFPMETEPGLRKMVPESGALFFLEKIEITVK